MRFMRVSVITYALGTAAEVFHSVVYCLPVKYINGFHSRLSLDSLRSHNPPVSGHQQSLASYAW